DLGAGKLTGEPITIVENVRTGSSAGHFSVSSSGTVAYARGGGGASNALYEAARSGKVAGNPLSTLDCVNPSLSPDGHRLLYEVTGSSAGASSEIWSRALERGTEVKLSFWSAATHGPVWSPDGKRFACELRSGTQSQVLIGS